MSFQDPDQREEWAKRSAAAAEEKAKAVEEKAKAVEALKRELELAKQQAATEPRRKSELDHLVEEARRHNLQLVTATWDGSHWTATFSRSGA